MKFYPTCTGYEDLPSFLEVFCVLMGTVWMDRISLFLYYCNGRICALNIEWRPSV